MPRPLRDCSAGLRHVVCRGNRRQAIFRDDEDRQSFVGLLGLVCRDFAWRVRAWCLMTNHIHLVLDVSEDTISRGMQLLAGRYAQAFNWRHGFTGHLFQGRFRSESIEDERYEIEVVRYVDLNPERAGAVEDARHWLWGGYRAEIGLEPPRSFHDVGWVRRFGADLVGAQDAYATYVAAGRHRPRPVAPAPPRLEVVSFSPVRGLTPDTARRDVSRRFRRPWRR